MNETRCEFSDLIASQCACHRCRPDVVSVLLDGELTVIPGDGHILDEPRNGIVLDSVPGVLRRFEASTRRDCDGCPQTIRPGDLIARTTDGEYVCSGCAA